jgi:[CysO sulfur-carrier protein]-S-L-cysteine hydrolase
VLRIAQAHLDAMITHARRDFPDEACGVVVGPEGADRPERFVAMTNVERSPTFFRFDPAEQLALHKEMISRDEEIVVVYHSHTATEAYPSRTDISYAAEPQAHYVLVSVAAAGADEGPVEVRSYRILEQTVTEEEIEITE